MGATGYIIKNNGGRGGEAQKEFVVSPADGTIDVEKVETFDKVDFRIKTTYDGYETIIVGSPASGGYFKAAHIKFNEENRRYRLVCILNGGSYTPVAKDFAIYYIKFGWRTGGVNADHWYIEEYSRQGNGAYVSLEQIALNEYNVLIHTPTGYAYANIGILKEDKEPDVTIDHFNNNTTRYTPTGTIIETETPVWKNGALVDTNSEDLEIRNGLLQLADRSAIDGLGYVILRPDKTFAEQVVQTNTIYDVRYNFDLEGGSVTIPTGCTLSFVGGSISNGILTGTNTYLKASPTKIFGDNLTISGQWNYDEAYPEWFGAIGDGTTDDTAYISLCVEAFKNVVLPQTYSITSVMVPAKTSITINKSVKSNGKGLVLNNECSVKGGIINVTAGNAGITLGDATINQNFRRRIIENIKFFGTKDANTAAIKCEASNNHYNCFDTIKDIVIYGIYYGIVGNIRASLIDAVIEQPNIGLQLDGDYLDCKIVGQSGTVADGNEYFCIISGTYNKLAARIYDLGVNENWQKYPCLFRGNLNEYDGGGEPITENYNAKVNKTWWRNLHKISEPNIRVKFNNVIGSNTALGTLYAEQLTASKFATDLRSRFIQLYPQEGEEICYVDFVFGEVANFLGVELLTFGNLYGFSKMEIYDNSTLLYTVGTASNGEIAYFRYSGLGDVVSNLIVRCYVTHEVRLVSGNLYATTASVIKKQITYTQADNAERKSLIKIVPNNVSASSASCILYVTNGGRFSEWFALIRCSFYGRYNLNNCGVSMEVISSSTNLTTEVFKRDTGSNYELVFSIKVPNIATNNMNVEILSNTSREPCYVEYVPTTYIRETEGIYTDTEGNIFLLAEEKQITITKEGTTAQRPTLTSTDAGYQYFDTDLGKPIYWTGAKWVDATGTDLQ